MTNEMREFLMKLDALLTEYKADIHVRAEGDTHNVNFCLDVSIAPELVTETVTVPHTTYLEYRDIKNYFGVGL